MQSVRSQLSFILVEKCLERKIRLGVEPDNPELLGLWLQEQERKIQQECYTIEMKRECYLAQFHLLLDVIADDLVLKHWRCLCLDNIFKPIASLKRLADDELSHRKIHQLVYELSVTSRYFQNGLN